SSLFIGSPILFLNLFFDSLNLYQFKLPILCHFSLPLTLAVNWTRLATKCESGTMEKNEKNTSFPTRVSLRVASDEIPAKFPAHELNAKEIQ
ncbi:MAG: hypothetical protein U9N34_06850, partial [Candidatus Cloacimonadota bacterium]|nr:hypothetical protein [Candidatus Cloacimonadota bacterium]